MGVHIHNGAIEQQPYPPVVKQILDPNTCWAAALSSWLKVVRNTDRDQMWLYEYFKQVGYCNEVGLHPSYVVRVLSDIMVRASYEEVTSGALKDGSYFSDKLRLSHLWFASSHGGIGHAVVIFGLKPSKDGLMLGMMDPFKGQIFGMKLEDFLNTRVQGNAYVGYVDFMCQIDGRTPWDW